MTRILIIDGHPHAEPEHFIHGAADAYARGAKSGHEVRRIDVASLYFPVLRSPDEWESGQVPPDIAEAQSDVSWADHIVFLYPLWLGDVPALLKAFLEQVVRPGFALRYNDKGFPEKLLKGKTARIIVSTGMPAPVYTLFYRAHSVRSFERNILSFVGIRPLGHTVIGAIEADEAARLRWLAKIEQMGQRAA
ncbi:MAG: NAD(P)H-dependent oxidoreductase [Novosphingobium sp.]|nr:NAD(P)H-dependent oxidoreductase [Novosphingobium sp.]